MEAARTSETLVNFYQTKMEAARTSETLVNFYQTKMEVARTSETLVNFYETKMEAARTSETSLNFYQTARRYNPEVFVLTAVRTSNPISNFLTDCNSVLMFTVLVVELQQKYFLLTLCMTIEHFTGYLISDLFMDLRNFLTDEQGGEITD
jgi:hypothetical protein